jgi:hypothetical protein
MKKIMFWILLLLGLFFLIGTIITVFSHTPKIQSISVGTILSLVLGTLLDFCLNPASWMGVILFILVFRIKNKI